MSRLSHGQERLVEVAAIDCGYEPATWAFASDRASAIDAHWRACVARKPRLFNGRVLLQHRGLVEPGPDGRSIFRGAYLETEFKAFLAWRDFGFPPAGVRNGFGMAALSSGDGAFILGEMASHTANGGKVYFPSGTPDPHDIRGTRVDIAGSIARELLEETGLAPEEVVFDAGFTLVTDDVRVGFMRRVRSREPAEALVARIHAFLARQTEPELARVIIVRRPDDIGPAVLPFVAHYLRAKLSAP